MSRKQSPWTWHTERTVLCANAKNTWLPHYGWEKIGKTQEGGNGSDE